MNVPIADVITHLQEIIDCVPEEQKHSFLSRLQLFIQTEITKIPRRIPSLYDDVVKSADKETRS